MKVVFFDGYCSLCNGLVDWLMKRDHSQEIKFASLQGKTAEQMLSKNYAADLNTVVYHREGRLRERSSAILDLVSDLGGMWKFVKIFYMIPRPVRDFVYKRVANNRYRFFKKRDTCRIPQPEELNRLLP